MVASEEWDRQGRGGAASSLQILSTALLRLEGKLCLRIFLCVCMYVCVVYVYPGPSTSLWLSPRPQTSSPQETGHRGSGDTLKSHSWIGRSQNLQDPPALGLPLRTHPSLSGLPTAPPMVSQMPTEKLVWLLGARITIGHPSLSWGAGQTHRISWPRGGEL